MSIFPGHGFPLPIPTHTHTHSHTHTHTHTHIHTHTHTHTHTHITPPHPPLTLSPGALAPAILPEIKSPRGRVWAQAGYGWHAYALSCADKEPPQAFSAEGEQERKEKGGQFHSFSFLFQGTLPGPLNMPATAALVPSWHSSLSPRATLSIQILKKAFFYFAASSTEVLSSRGPERGGPEPEEKVVLLVERTGPGLKLEASSSRAAPA